MLRAEAVAATVSPAGFVKSSWTVSAVGPVSPSRSLTTTASDSPSESESTVETRMSTGMRARKDCPVMPKMRSRTSTASSSRPMRRVVPATG